MKLTPAYGLNGLAAYLHQNFRISRPLNLIQTPRSHPPEEDCL
jgi:hypothetical protein